mmetsp:Transcript_53111/g.99549  ORF Transcript_53111/g.99549 Transcript_53111/m.99549 type:complete len:706 (+) Transcript_53111:92-2209(+)
MTDDAVLWPDEIPQENETEAAGGQALFDTVTGEPYETVFADPPAQEHQEERILLRNLDTGEVQPLAYDALNADVPAGLNLDRWVQPQQLAEAPGKPWRRFWSEKRQKDECLWRAAESGRVNALQEALAAPKNGDAPAEVNSRSLYGRTALHIAATVGRPECAAVLLDANADVDACTDAGLTALHIASQRGHLEVARLLLDWRAQVDLESKEDRNSAMHLAAANGQTDVVRLLVERGSVSQLQVRNNFGQRPAEASLDIRTAELFRSFERAGSFGEHDASASEEQQDRYAGRTPFYEGTVLLPNARADVVRRLLQRTRQHLPDHDEHVGSMRRSASSQQPFRVPTREPFARVRPGDLVNECVGPDSFEYMQLLGKGAFGEVHQVKHKGSQQIYAMKILRKSKIFSGNLLRYAMTERNVLSYIRHPYIVSLHYAFQTSCNLVLVLQFCPRGNLQQLITRERHLQEPVARLYAAELLLALEHLHERKIVFRDLKPDNVVIDECGHSLLTDFGLSKEGVAGVHGTKSFCGSVAFLAPEILQRKGHGHTVDIYGLGVILFDMLTGLPPFYDPDKSTLFKNIKHATLKMPAFIPRRAAELIEALMARDPSNRLGANSTSEVREHAYFSEMDFNALMRREVPVPGSLPGRWAEKERATPARGKGKATNPASPFTPTNFKTGNSRTCRKARRREGPQAVLGWEFSTLPAPILA